MISSDTSAFEDTYVTKLYHGSTITVTCDTIVLNVTFRSGTMQQLHTLRGQMGHFAFLEMVFP